MKFFRYKLQLLRKTRQQPSTRQEEDEEGGEWGSHNAKPKKGKFFSLISFSLSTNKYNIDNDSRPLTHPHHCHEPLLVGWLCGGACP